MTTSLVGGDNALPTRTCRHCLKDLPIQSFYKHQSGYRWVCKHCHTPKTRNAVRAVTGKPKLPRTPGVERPELKATEHPTLLDIAWAAGVYEGEGSVARTRGSTRITVTQKDRWILDRLRALFGGKVYKNFCSQRGDYPDNYIHSWQLHGARARGFIFTIFSFLSPRRRSRIRWGLGYDG